MGILTCSHIKPSLVDDLHADQGAAGHAPSIVSCGGCTHVTHGEHSKSFDFLQGIEPLPVSPGHTLLEAIQHMPGFNVDRRDETLYALTYNGQLVGTIWVIRQTAQGRVWMFSGSTTPWHQRIIHPDDVAIGFGTDIGKPVQGFHEVWNGIKADLPKRVAFRAHAVLRCR